MRNPRGGAVPAEGRRPARSGDTAAGWADGHSERSPLALFVTAFRWHLRIGALYLTREFLRTPQGWGLPVLVLISSPALVHLVAEGAWASGAGLDAQSRAGALALAHAALVLCLASMLPPTLLRDLVSWRERDPLEAHPWALPEAGLARVAGGALWTSGFLVLFFLLFHHPLLRGVDATTASPVASGGTGGTHGWLLPAVHAVALFVHLVGLAALGFRLLAGWASRQPPHHHGLPPRHRLLIVPFLLAFPTFAFVPALLGEQMPGLLSALGGAALSGNALKQLAGWLLQPPAAGVFLATRGDVGEAAAWFGATFGLAGLAWWTLWRNRTDLALVDRGLGQRTESGRAPAFAAPPTGPAPLREFRLFWEKDVLARQRGSAVRRRVREHGPVLLWIGAAAWLAPHMIERMATTPEATLIVTGLIPIVLAAGASLRQGVPSLGLEGPHVELLRALLPVRRLFIAKLSVNTLVVLPRASGYAAAASLALSLSGVPTPGPGAALVLGAGAGAVLSLSATAVGFLLPDPAQRSLILPGASLSGQLLFGCLAGVLVVGQGLILHPFFRGEVSAPLALGLGVVVPSLVSGTALVLTLFALHRLENLDR